MNSLGYKSFFASLAIMFFTSSFGSAQKPNANDMQLDTIERRTETAEQPKNPSFSITVEKVGEPSLKTLYKVPVKVIITSNRDYAINMVSPYLANSSFSPIDITQKIKQIAKSEAKLAVVIVGMLACGSIFCIPLYLLNDWTLFEGLGVPLAAIGAWLGFVAQPAIFISNLTEQLIQLDAHGTTTFKGYINKADMEKIQNGQLTPMILFKI